VRPVRSKKHPREPWGSSKLRLPQGSRISFPIVVKLPEFEEVLTAKSKMLLYYAAAETAASKKFPFLTFFSTFFNFFSP
jgi:hypothetical protein